MWTETIVFLIDAIKVADFAANTGIVGRKVPTENITLVDTLGALFRGSDRFICDNAQKSIILQLSSLPGGICCIIFFNFHETVDSQGILYLKLIYTTLNNTFCDTHFYIYFIIIN